MRHARRYSPALLAVCLGLAAVAGCATASSAPRAQSAVGAADSAAPAVAASAASPETVPQGVNVAAFRALARKEAAEWAHSPLGKVWDTGLVLPAAYGLSVAPSSGFPTGEDKEAFVNGDLVFTGPPPSGSPAGVVTWPDGSTMRVPVLSEAQAFSALKDNGGCAGCKTTPLDVTAAQPTTMRVATSRGTASVPAWAFTIQGVSGQFLQAALGPGSYVTMASYSAPKEKTGPIGRDFAEAAVPVPSADGRTLTLKVWTSSCGNPEPARGGLVSEVGGVVVVGAWMQRPRQVNTCMASLAGYDVTVRLAEPLGARVVLDAATGQAEFPEPSR